jgi:UDP-N-acetylglucosamine 2-epimerase (non-hydrolysing)
MVLTDSGGIQEETSYLKVPCLTIRRNTERPVTVESGNNIIAGTEPEAILNSFEKLKSRFSAEKVKPIKFWDGRTASRIVRVLIDEAKR